MTNRIKPPESPLSPSRLLPAEEAENVFSGSAFARDLSSFPGSPLMPSREAASRPVRPRFKKGERIEMEIKGLHIEWLEGKSGFPVKVTNRYTENIQHIRLPHFIGHFSIRPVSEDAFHIQHTRSGSNIAGFRLPARSIPEKPDTGEPDQHLKNLPATSLNAAKRLINLVHVWFSPGHSIR
ncbi:MAG: hypothetical protein PW790_09080 [Parvibaculaceae bacterium]|nr:hypothetical protein [Parvibaculaceae bacterium]